jgi:hypothetical protein
MKLISKDHNLTEDYIPLMMLLIGSLGLCLLLLTQIGLRQPDRKQQAHHLPKSRPELLKKQHLLGHGFGAWVSVRM